MSGIQDFLDAIPLPPGSEIVNEQYEECNEVSPYDFDPYGRCRKEVWLLDFICDGGWNAIREHYEDMLTPRAFFDLSFLKQEMDWEQLLKQMEEKDIDITDTARRRTKFNEAKQRIVESNKELFLYYGKLESEWYINLINHPRSAQYQREQGMEPVRREDAFQLFVIRMY